MIYLESENLNEPILLPSLGTVQNRMEKGLSIMRKNAKITNIMDTDAVSIIELYGKSNRVEHRFRTMNTIFALF